MFLEKSEQQSNEIQFNDAKDAEELNIHASKDYENDIKQSMAVNINENSTDKINQDRTIFSQQDHTIIINKKINIAAGKGEITINPDSITLQSPSISLGDKFADKKAAAAIAAGAASSSGGKNEDKTTDQSDQQEENMYPSAEMNINALELTLPSVSLQYLQYSISATNILNGSLKVSNKKSVDPSTFKKDGEKNFRREVISETRKVFSNLKITNAVSILGEKPTLTLYNDYDEYNFALTATIITENEQQYPN